ncbi:MAG: ATP-binding protein [Polyangiaceae bacterium]|nr:ATP-binding protein [Polyangiaceae bacterium]
MQRHFNTAGPNNPEYHYTVPAAGRLPDARDLIDQQGYFVVHAPRQTGKTTTLRALAKELTAEGRYAALHFTCEEASVAGDDYAAASRAIVARMVRAAEQLPLELRPPPLPAAHGEQLLGAALEAWAKACPRPLVLIFDEIDSLIGDSLISVLRQLRAGFPDRPDRFPWSVILCGMRDIRDYKLASGGNPPRLGSSSPFNVKVESNRLGDFSLEEVRLLYGLHTAETGQVFTEEALVRAFDLSQGQPWLVNALAREVVDKMKVPPTEAIQPTHLDEAKERLILARATHLDSLLARLTEPRVRRIVEPLIAGDAMVGDDLEDDVKYTRDLGLIARKNPVRVANPIYREVIARVLAGAVEANVTDEPRAFVLPDGRLAFRRLLRAFGRFWREHGNVLLGATPYHEVAAQLVFMAFLQRIVNGGGYVDREYGVGRGRIDLLVRWPLPSANGRSAVQRRAIEIKVWRPQSPDPLKKGLEQLDGYLAALGLGRGTLVIFDRRKKATRKPVFLDTTTRRGRAVRLLRA